MHEHIVQAHPNGGQRGRRDAGDGKMRGVVANLPSYAEVEADIVVINKNFESNSSNTVNFSTPEGGQFLKCSLFFFKKPILFQICSLSQAPSDDVDISLFYI